MMDWMFGVPGVCPLGFDMMTQHRSLTKPNGSTQREVKYKH